MCIHRNSEDKTSTVINSYTMTGSSPTEPCKERQYFSNANGGQCKDLEMQGNKYKYVTEQ